MNLDHILDQLTATQIDAANMVAGELVTTTAENTARFNARSDEIIAMQRAAKCQADPAKCS